MKIIPILTFALLTSLAPGADSRGAAGPPSTDLPVLKLPLEVRLQNLDFTNAEDFVTIRVLLNLGSGLVSLDRDLHPQPSLAKSWKISKNRSIYTFTLASSHWSNGQPITSTDFIRGLRHTLSPSTPAKIAIPLIDLIRGAQDYKSGKLQDFSKVGIAALDEHTLRFQLNHPASYFLALLALPPAFPEPEQAADFQVKPDIPSSGSYFLEKKDSAKWTLAPNSFSIWPAQNRLEFIFVPEGATAVSLYEKKDLDVIFRLSGSDFERFKNSPELTTAPWLSTYYLGFNVTKAPFNDIVLRQAVCEAIDRTQVNKFMKDSQSPSSSWVPAPLETSEFSYGPHFNPADAKKLWAAANFRPDHLELVFDSQEKNNLIVAFIQAQLKNNLGADLRLRSLEWKSYLHFLKDHSPPFFRFGWLAAFPDPLSHLGVFTSGNPNNETGYSSPVYDKLVAEVAKTPEGTRRRALIKKAQDQLLTKDMVIFPLFHYVQYTLIRRSWQGLDLTPMGLLYFQGARQVSSSNRDHP